MKRKVTHGRAKTHDQSASRGADFAPPRKHVNFPGGDFETVDPIWLLKAAGLTLLAAALLAYVSVCAYVGYSAWRNLLRPTHETGQTPSEPYTAIQFDSAETGSPRLSGWWVPAADAAATTPTLLFLHSGDGSLSANVPEIDELHQAGVNLFAIDYRGYGGSDSSTHPTEQSMREDSSAALGYLLNTRHIPASTIIPYGTGLGAVFAATLVQDHSDLPAVAIDNPWPSAVEHVLDDPRYRFLPIRFLLKDRFDLEAPLNAIEKPKLLVSGGPGAAESRHTLPGARSDAYDATSRLEAYFGSITDPKTVVNLVRAHAHLHAAAQAAKGPSNTADQVPQQTAHSAAPVKGQDDERLSQALVRFLDQNTPLLKPAVHRD